MLDVLQVWFALSVTLAFLLILVVLTQRVAAAVPRALRRLNGNRRRDRRTRQVATSSG